MEQIKNRPPLIAVAAPFGCAGVFGSMLLIPGIILIWILSSQSDITTFMYFWGDLGMAEGTAIFCDTVRQSEGARPLYVNNYSYTLNLQEYKDYSFSRERCIEKGDTVTVEYSLEDPSISRIKGMERAETPWWILLILSCFPLAGLGIITASVVGFFLMRKKAGCS
jgi:hypothetical protein